MFLIFSVSILLLTCNKKQIIDKILICGVENPLEELYWLKKLIQKADNDTTGHYMGTIYLEKIGNEDAFFVEMSMGSGGIYTN